MFNATLLSASVGLSFIPIFSRFQKSSTLGFRGSDLSTQDNIDVSLGMSVPYVSMSMLDSVILATVSEALPDKFILVLNQVKINQAELQSFVAE